MSRRNPLLTTATIALVIALLYAVYGWLAPTYSAQSVIYPLLVVYHRTALPLVGLMVLAAAVTFVLMVVRLITQHRRLDSESPVRKAAKALIVFVLAAFVAIGAAIPAAFVTAAHLSSAAFNEHVYNLAFWQFIDGDNRYIFYECDSLGVTCQQRHVEPIDSWRGEVTERAEIITDEAANMVSLQVAGETVYRSDGQND